MSLPDNLHPGTPEDTGKSLQSDCVDTDADNECSPSSSDVSVCRISSIYREASMSSGHHDCAASSCRVCNNHNKNGTVSSGDDVGNCCTASRCDVCDTRFSIATDLRYCRSCHQRLCDRCSSVHGKLAASRHHETEHCWPSCKRVDRKYLDTLLHNNDTVDAIAWWLSEKTGLQVCHSSSDDETVTLNVLAPSNSILDIVFKDLETIAKDMMLSPDELRGLDFVPGDSEGRADVAAFERKEEEPNNNAVAMASLHVEKGRVYWCVKGYRADVLRTIFRKELHSLVDSSPDVDIVSVPSQQVGRCHALKQEFDDVHTKPRGESPLLTISCSFDKYTTIDAGIRDLSGKLDKMHTTEVEVPTKNTFQMELYITAKAVGTDVFCFAKTDPGTSTKLAILSLDETKVQAATSEFLGLYCKECSVCHQVHQSLIYLDCKHTLCNVCVSKARHQNDVDISPENTRHQPNDSQTPTHRSSGALVALGQRWADVDDNLASIVCLTCVTGQGRVIAVRPLQVLCLQMIEEVANRPTFPKEHAEKTRPVVAKSTERKRASPGKHHVSTRVPKYLLQKWGRRGAGGLTRLRRLIQDDLGFRVGGSDDNMKIYGETPELLDLVIQSIDQINQPAPDNGVTCTLAERKVVWRFRGDNARIIHFLFNKELRDLVNSHTSIEMKCFTNFHPPVLDVKCPFDKYMEVKYKLDELVNEITHLYEDEYIQPKSFYYNIKVREFLDSKRNSEFVFCDLHFRNNLNVIVIKTRYKEYINLTKDEIVNW